MITFIFGIIALIIAVIAWKFFVRSKKNSKEYTCPQRSNYDFLSDYKSDLEEYNLKVGYPIMYFIVSIVAILCAICLLLASVVYSQDVGEVKVLRNMGGSIAGTSSEAGFHIKAPWQDAITYDIRNNVLSFMGDEEADQFEGGSANGSAVTVNDSSGTSATIDIQCNYSLDPSAAEQLYADYGTQENFVKSICAVDIRSVPREVSGQFDTISILTTRSDFTSAVQDALTEKWKQYGLNVEQVSIQNVVYPQSIKDKYSEATAAEVARQTAENNLKIAEVDAQTQVTKAKGEAEANEVLQKSLTSSVIQSKYIDALKEIGEKGNLVVVPEGSQPLVNASK